MKEPNLYEVLGCTSSATTEQLLAEYRARVLVAHPDKQLTDQSDDFRRLQQAKEVLTDPAKRRHYDTYLSMSLGLPLDEWMKKREHFAQTFHWVAPTQEVRALASRTKTENVHSPEEPNWQERYHSTSINAFRNYEI